MAIVVLGFIMLLYLKIQSGQGAQTYSSGTQIQQTYIATAISFALVGVILLAIGFKQLKDRWNKRTRGSRD